jgi:hypothetical protein
VSTLKSAGWVVELSRCDHLDNEPGNCRWFAVNLIAPQGDKSTDWTAKTDELESIHRDVAWTDLGEFLFPWTWEHEPPRWALFGRATEGGQWEPVAGAQFESGVDKVDVTDAASLRKAFRHEVEQRTSDCAAAFSARDERWQGQPRAAGDPVIAAIVEQSYVHALAPPTHAPAALSNDVFRCAGFLKLPDATFANYVSFVAFPLIKTAAVEYAPQSVEDIDPQLQPDAVRAKYAPQFGSIDLLCKSFAISSTSNDLAKWTAAQVNEGRLADQMVESLFVADGMPIEILATAMAEAEFPSAADPTHLNWPLLSEKVFPQRQWQYVLAFALGSGWFRRRQSRSNERPHVLQYASTRPEREDLDKVFPHLESVFVPPRDPSQGSDAEVWLKAMRDAFREESATLSREDAALLEALDTLCNPITELDLTLGADAVKARLEERVRFLRAWAYIALDALGERRAQVLRAWLTMRVRLHAAAGDKNDMRVICEMLARAVSTDAADRLLLGTLDDVGPAAIWPLLLALADTGENEAAEKEKIDLIGTWVAGRIDEMLKAPGGAQSLPQPSRIGEALEAAKGALRSDFKERTHRLVRRDYDEGLLIRFDGADEQHASTNDRLIRGYAVALRSGVIKQDGSVAYHKDSRAWVTLTSVLCYPKPTGQQVGKPFFLHSQADAAVVETAGAIGSMRRNGQRVVQLSYRGAPVFASAIGMDPPVSGAPDPDEFASLDFRLQPTTAARLPLLGYGSRFSGLCTALDNAGGVIAEKLRKTGLVTSFKDFDDVEDQWSAQTLKYVSCVPPGAPTVKSIEITDGKKPFTGDAYELSDQTRAVAFVSQKLNAVRALTEDDRRDKMRAIAAGGALPRVACLAWNSRAKDGDIPLYRDDRPRIFAVTLAPPAATRDFVNCWLATDRLEQLTGNNNFSDKDFTPATVLAFVDKFRNERSPHREYHPAVTALGIEFDFGDPSVYPPAYVTAPITRTKKNANGELDAKGETVRIEISVKPGLTQPGSPKYTPGQVHQVSLEIPPGCVVRLRSYALVDNDYFDSSDSRQRFYQTLPHEDVKAFPRHRSFGPIEYWVESLPKWEKTPSPESDYLDIEVARPAIANEYAQRLLFKPGALRADWIHAVEINRHSWHWTGYPVSFPPWQQGAELMRWLPAFAGAESNRELLTRELPTRIEGRAWRFGSDELNLGVQEGQLVLHEHRLRAGERPSQYAAYTVKPVVRFASWLDPSHPSDGKWPRDLARDIFAAADVIQGMGAFGETLRLPAPAFEFHIPLTASYQYDPSESYGGLPLGRSVNGNLLIFGDAIRRTDSFARSGGIGDTIEVDVLRTRRVDAAKQDFAQLGPNPIFHAAPGGTGMLPPDFHDRTLRVSEPHGLTYDLVRNAKVAQTAILVQPAKRNAADESQPTVDDVPDEWLLAQVRVRRLILPETQLNSELQAPDNEPMRFPLRWRTEGMERVPYDFALDINLTARASPALTIDVVAEDDSQESYQLDIPDPLPTEKRVRLLVSFHKGRWDPEQPAGPLQGLPYWAPQVYAQVQNNTTLGWTTIRKLTCHGKLPWSWRTGKLKLSVANASKPRAYAVQLSDYTDARWLLFMGRIPGTGKQPPEEYRLTPRIQDETLRLSLAGGAFGVLTPPPVPSASTPEPWLDKAVEFFVLFVSAPQSDLIGGVHGAEDFGLLTFRPVPDAGAKRTLEFEQMGGPRITDVSKLQGAIGVLCSFQRISSPSTQERQFSVDSFDRLLEAMFPPDASDEWRPRESLVRPTGSHWGPMVVRF